MWKAFVLDGGLANGTQGELDTGLVGKKGIVLAALVPNGKVMLDNKTYDATNIDGTLIEKGAEIEVVAWDSFKLKIKKIEK
jgi:Membrane-bound serine protease (ClpP class)